MSRATKCRVCGDGYETFWAHKTICPRCDIGLSSIQLTSSMESSLAYLLQRKARARALAVYVEHGLTHRSALRKRGLIDSEYRSEQRRTYYWVTPLGREVHRRFRRAA